MTALYRTVVKTELGSTIAISSDRGLCTLEFHHPDRQVLLSDRLRHWFPDHELSKHDHSVLKSTRTWLESYFSGAFDSLKPLPLDLRGTDFERSVWDLLLEIPLGSTATYGELAARLDRRHGARAVGLAVGRNPVSIIVPCHRVVGSNGSLTGYGGGIERKRWLLGHECSAAPGLFSAASSR
jgi:O-6-methylguanine DNA methyltransferase